MLDLTWGCKIVGWGKKIESFSWLVHQKGVLFFSLNIPLFFSNKLLVIFKKSVILFLHFIPVRMKTSMDQTSI